MDDNILPDSVIFSPGSGGNSGNEFLLATSDFRNNSNLFMVVLYAEFYRKVFASRWHSLNLQRLADFNLMQTVGISRLVMESYALFYLELKSCCLYWFIAALMTNSLFNILTSWYMIYGMWTMEEEKSGEGKDDFDEKEEEKET